MNGTTITHLASEFDSIRMEVRLPLNKHSRVLHIVTDLLKARAIRRLILDEALGFVSHCCQVVPLGCSFLRNIFSTLRRVSSSHPFGTRLSRAATKDLQWWFIFLSSRSIISVIQLSRINHDVAMDTSGKKGIGRIYNKQIFSDRVLVRHRQKHINWKKMFAILRGFVLRHEQWATGMDNVGPVSFWSSPASRINSKINETESTDDRLRIKVGPNGTEDWTRSIDLNRVETRHI